MIIIDRIAVLKTAPVAFSAVPDSDFAAVIDTISEAIGS